MRKTVIYSVWATVRITILREVYEMSISQIVEINIMQLM